MDLFRLEYFDVSAIARYLLCRASGHPDALEQFSPEEDDGPLDGLITFYEIASSAQRKLLLDGLVRAIEWQSANGAIQANDNVAIELLKILPVYIRSGSEEMQSRAAKTVSTFIIPGRHNISRLAALSLSEIKSHFAVQLLDSFSSRNPTEYWSIPILLSARSKISVFDALMLDFERMRPQIQDPVFRFAVQDCLRRMLDDDTKQARKSILKSVENWPTQGRSLISELLSELAEQLNLESIKAICDELTPPIEDQLARGQLEILGKILSELDDALFANPDKEQIDRSYLSLLDFVTSLSNEALPGQWSIICGYAEKCGREEYGSRGLEVLTEVALKLTPKIGLNKLSQMQNRFFSGMARDGRKVDIWRNTIIQQVAGHVGTIKTANYPKVLRIARTQFAEDVYIELFSIVLKAAYPSMEIVFVPGISWDKIDSKILSGEIDIALNNDDILNYDDWSEDDVIARSDGPPLYKIKDFTMIADAMFLRQHGISVEAIEQAQKSSEPIFSQAFANNTELHKILKNSTIVTSEAIVLDRLLDNMLAEMSVSTPDVTRRDPHIALNYFLEQKVNILFGGIIHTEYALSRWSRAVPLLRLSEEVEGRLFARLGLINEYPEFSAKLLLALNEVDNLWNRQHLFSLSCGFEEYLIQHVNLTMNDLVAGGTSGDNVSLASVLSIAELRKILGRSPLTPGGKKRKWIEFKRKPDEKKPPQLTVVPPTPAIPHKSVG